MDLDTFGSGGSVDRDTATETQTGKWGREGREADRKPKENDQQPLKLQSPKPPPGPPKPQKLTISGRPQKHVQKTQECNGGRSKMECNRTISRRQGDGFGYFRFGRFLSTETPPQKHRPENLVAIKPRSTNYNLSFVFSVIS